MSAPEPSAVMAAAAGVLSGAWFMFCLLMTVSTRARNRFCDFLDERRGQ